MCSIDEGTGEDRMACAFKHILFGGALFVAGLGYLAFKVIH